METTDQGGQAISCPGESVWLDIAAGITQSGESARMLEHAAICESCARALRESLRLAGEEASAEETQTLQALASSKPAWQRSLAAEIASQADTRRRPAWPVWLAAAAVLLISGGIVAMLRSGGRSTPERQLKEIAAAYSNARPFEFRLSGAAYGQVRVTRGSGAATASADLLDAEAEISRQLALRPGDPDWLCAQGHADLLEGRYDAAIDELDHARRAGAASCTLNDLAVAHLLRGQVKPDSAEVAAAAGLLDEALAKDPGNSVCLFNRALAREIAGMPGAEPDWREFLRREPTGGWAVEAQEHLRRLEQPKR